MKKNKKKNRNKKLNSKNPQQVGQVVIGVKPDGSLFHKAFMADTIEEVIRIRDEYVESFKDQ